MNAMDNKPVIIIPTNRTWGFFKEFLNAWNLDFLGCHLIIVEDREKKQFKKMLDKEEHAFTYDVYDWRDIDRDLGKNAWIIPRKTDAVRSYGFLKSMEGKPLFCVTLDDDVRPMSGGEHIKEFGRILLDGVDGPEPEYFSTLKDYAPRGTPFRKQKPLLAHGMWLGCTDLGAMTQLVNHHEYGEEYDNGNFNEGLVPKGALFGVCSMNVAWHPSITHHMYFGLQGNLKSIPRELWEFCELPLDNLDEDGYFRVGHDRHGDIWTGYKVKRKLDINDARAHTGKPYVLHQRASNVWASIGKEEPGQEYQKEFVEAGCSYWNAQGLFGGWYWTLQTKAEVVWRDEIIKRIGEKYLELV